MSNAFLSYARADASNEVDRLRRDLEAAGRNPWVDRFNLRGGEEWGPEIKDAIRKAEAFILLLTPAAVTSPEVEKEYKEALRLKKHLLPLMIKECKPPADINPLNYLDLSGSDRHPFARLLRDMDAGWEKVANALSGFDLTDYSLQFDALLDKLRRLSDQRGKLDLPPEVYLAFADIVKHMMADARPDRDLRTLVDQLLDNTYLNDSWEWRAVFQAHPDFFVKQLRDWQARLPNQPAGQPVPIVLLVMTRQEALELKSGAALKNESEELQAVFTKLQARIEAEPSTADWAERYGTKREDWTPYGPGTEGLASLVREQLRRAGEDFAPPKPFIPKFIDIVDVDGPNNRVKLRDLRSNGCVVIMDVLSICHPGILARYRRSLLDAYPKTFLVKVSPLGFTPNFQQPLTFRVQQPLDLEFSYRLELDSDDRCKRFTEFVELRNYIYNHFWQVTPESAWPQRGPKSYY